MINSKVRKVLICCAWPCNLLASECLDKRIDVVMWSVDKVPQLFLSKQDVVDYLFDNLPDDCVIRVAY